MENTNALPQPESHQEKVRRLEDELWLAKRQVALLTLSLWLAQHEQGATR